MATRILVIDDDGDVRESLREYLEESLGFEVHVAAERCEAEGLLAAYDYAAVITDLSLDAYRMEGLDLLDTIASLPKRPKLIAFSGNSDAEVQKVACAKGADAFVVKGRPLREIVDALRSVVDRPKPSLEPLLEAGSGSELLRKVLAPGGVSIKVQPIYRLNYSDAIYGVECLTRGPVGTPFENPEALFGFARQKRVEAVLDAHCVAEAVDSAAAWLDEGLQIGVNVHASTLGRDPEIAAWICRLAELKLGRASRLTVEIVEHAPAWNDERFRLSLRYLRNKGVKIALDDVGVGHSNYKMIVDARPDFLKVDRYFVTDCSRDPVREAVLRSITRLANDLGADVVAEGIECVDDMLIAAKAGITYGQGYLFGRPVSARELLCARSSWPSTDRVQAGEVVSAAREVRTSAPSVGGSNDLRACTSATILSTSVPLLP